MRNISLSIMQGRSLFFFANYLKASDTLVLPALLFTVIMMQHAFSLKIRPIATWCAIWWVVTKENQSGYTRRHHYNPLYDTADL